MNKIIRNIKVPTGNILVIEGDKGKIECLSLGDYGRVKNVKADFLGLNEDIQGVPNGEIMPLEEKWVITVSTQIGCSMNCKFCLLPDTPVLMADYSYKPIKDIYFYDEVISNVDLKENKDNVKQYASLKTTTSKVVGLIKRLYSGDVYTIETKSGYKISCTDEHPIAAKYKSRNLFKKASEMRVGDKIIVGRKTSVENYKNNDWKLGWVFGFLYGDGCYDEIDGKRWQVTQKYKYILEYFISIADEFGIKTSAIWEQIDKDGRIAYRFAIQGKQVDALNDLFSKDSKDFKIGFLAGFWDAEGFSFKNNQSVRVCNTDIANIELVELFLNDLGYETSRYENKRQESYYKKLITVNVRMSRDEFISVFTPVHHKKLFLGESKSRKFCSFDTVSKITIEKYSGFVYNIETTEHNYFACDILNHNCDVPKVGPGVNVTKDDLTNQVISALKIHQEVKATKRLNVHYARMGEPTFNKNVLDHARRLRKEVRPFVGRSHVHPVVSTMLPRKNKNLVKFLQDWCEIKNYDYRGAAGLQFSINSTDDNQREYLFSGNSLKLKDISEIGKYLPDPIGRKYALNIALTDNSIIDANRMAGLFSPDKFMVKITPIHETNSCIKNGITTTNGYSKYTPYKEVEENLKNVGFDVLVFVPSLEEDQGRITCGNAILSGSKPLCEYTEIVG